MGYFVKKLLGLTPKKNWLLQITYKPTASSSEEILVEKERMIDAFRLTKGKMIFLKEPGAPVIINDMHRAKGSDSWYEGLTDSGRPLVLNLDLNLKISKSAKISDIRDIESDFITQIALKAMSGEDSVPGFKSDQLSVSIKNPEQLHETDLAITYDLSPFPHHLKEKSRDLQKVVYNAIGQLGATEVHDDHLLKESLHHTSDSAVEQDTQFDWTIKLKGSNRAGDLVDRATEAIKKELGRSLGGHHVASIQMEARAADKGLSDKPLPPRSR